MSYIIKCFIQTNTYFGRAKRCYKKNLINKYNLLYLSHFLISLFQSKGIFIIFKSIFSSILENLNLGLNINCVCIYTKIV